MEATTTAPKTNTRLEIMKRTAKAEREQATKAKEERKAKGRKAREEALAEIAKTENETREPELPKANVEPALKKALRKAGTKPNGHPAPSLQIASELQTAFDHFNRELFGGKLPPVVFTFVKLKKARGHFHAGQWSAQGVEQRTHEIALDPVACELGGDEIAASVLVHEMVHELEQEEGRGPKKAYHSKTWAENMHKVGLRPIGVSSKGEPTGKETGPNATHAIVDDGPFAKAWKKLAAEGWKLTWSCLPPVVKAKKGKGGGEGKSTEGKRQTFCCPECDAKAWAKFSAKLKCGECDTDMEPAAKKD